MMNNNKIRIKQALFHTHRLVYSVYSLLLLTQQNRKQNRSLALGAKNTPSINKFGWMLAHLLDLFFFHLCLRRMFGGRV